jgi:hypothetical protein
VIRVSPGSRSSPHHTRLAQPATFRALTRRSAALGHADARITLQNAPGFPDQQPDGDDTPGVAAAPVALAAGIVPGVDIYIVVPSAHAEVFGVGITPVAGSMLVSPSWLTSCRIVPGGGLAGISGVESGRAAPLVGGPPGTELQTVVEELPSGAVGEMVPVVLATIDVGMVPNAAAPGISAFGDIVIGAVPPGMEVFGTIGVDGAGIAAVVDAGELAGSVSAGAATANVGGTGIVVNGIVDKKDVAG